MYTLDNRVEIINFLLQKSLYRKRIEISKTHKLYKPPAKIAICGYYFYNSGMKFTFVNLTAVLILSILFLSACNEDPTGDGKNPIANSSNQPANANGETANAARDDIDELGKIIKLPVSPEEANYWEENLSGTDSSNQNSVSKAKKIVAVLKFSSENAAQLISNIEKIKPPTDSEIDAENRFPAELIAQSQLSGDETLKGKSYAADDFLQTPYNVGKITRIENTDYFVLELTTD